MSEVKNVVDLEKLGADLQGQGEVSAEVTKYAPKAYRSATSFSMLQSDIRSDIAEIRRLLDSLERKIG